MAWGGGTNHSDSRTTAYNDLVCRKSAINRSQPDLFEASQTELNEGG